ncbi:RNA methyltransferase, partial [Desulfovibrio sp. OttesenSCG-928-G11]|nr:RNA methyltransferase [Desulfovibrio sp. OttesenSCG-928-G11]
KIKRVLALRQKDLTLVLANIHDAHNVSAIYRSCDAFGVPEVHLYYTDTPFPVLGAKSSASARKWINTVRHKNADELFAALRSRAMRIYATSCSPAARPFFELDFTAPTAFVMGNEHRGLDETFLPLVDGEIYIPMYGMIQSFNVSVAAALLLSEAARQRRNAGAYQAPTYSEEELAALFAAWSEK